MPSSYQVALVNATFEAQNILTNKQSSDAESGTLASNLLQAEFNDSTTVLNEDTTNVNNAATAGNQGDWTQTETNAYNQATEVYQNDTTVAETGQTNATNATNAEQSQVSQDGTNLSNFLSLSNILMQIGTYVSGLLGSTYA